MLSRLTRFSLVFVLVSEREEAKRRERAWASLNATAMKNPLYKVVVSGCCPVEAATPSPPPNAPPPSNNNTGANGGGGKAQLLQQSQRRSEGSSPLIDADEDVGASLRSLQQESEEEVSRSLLQKYPPT